MKIETLKKDNKKKIAIDAIIPIKHLISFCNNFNITLDYIFNLSNQKEYAYIRNEINLQLAGLRLKEFRKDKKITQNKLALELNTTQGVIANYERDFFL